jgi:hypothetical protein
MSARISVVQRRAEIMAGSYMKVRLKAGNPPEGGLYKLQAIRLKADSTSFRQSA